MADKVLSDLTEEEAREVSDRVAQAVTFALTAAGLPDACFAVAYFDESRDVRIVSNICHGCAGKVFLWAGKKLAGPCDAACGMEEAPGD